MRKSFLLLLITILAFSCKKEDDKVILTPSVVPNTGVIFNTNEVPYETLSEYAFFLGDIKSLSPNARVMPYSLISSLFTDYAKKKRFIWMPEGEKAQYTSDNQIFDFPDETVTIKNFYYENVLPDMTTRIIETRLIYKKDGQWVFAEYVWNDEQTEAYLDMEGSFTPIEWLENGVEKSANYRIPNESQCLTCHKITDDPVLIGPKPQNMNKEYAYEDGSMNQLDKWVEEGILESNYPAEITTVVNWEDEGENISERMRSYVDINCAHCHSAGSHCSYRSMRFAYSESAVDSLMGICVEPDENIDQSSVTHIIASGNIDRSMVYYRLNTENESERMPLLGRTIIHEEALVMIEEYINSLSPPCN